MKGKSVKGFLLLLGLSGALFAAAAPVSIISNGGFESGVTGWSLDKNGDTAQATRIIDSVSGDAHEGTKFHRITVTAVSSQNWHIQLKDPTWEAKKGYIYHFSMWARADAAHKVGLSVYGNANDKSAYRTSSTVTLTTEWMQYHQMFISDAEGMGQINFAVVCGSEVGVYDIDDVVITETLNPPGNLYPNGGFEADGAGWSLQVASGEDKTGAATLTYPTTGAKTGTKFGRIAITAAPAESWEVQLQDGSWEAKLDSAYTFKFWAKADAGQQIEVAAQAGSSRDYDYLDGKKFTLTTEWTEYEFVYVAEVAGKDSISFNIFLGAAVGVYDFDDISLLEPVPPISVTAQNRLAAGNGGTLSVRIMPEILRCTMDAPFTGTTGITIHDVAGRLLSAKSIATSGRSFDLPRPPCGTWIVGVNSGERRVISVP